MRDPSLTDALMPFGEHLDELRKRLIIALVGVLPIFVVTLIFGQSIVAYLIQPLRESQKASGMPQELQAINVLETFNTYLKVSFIATVVVGAPWILYQFWLFVAPGLYLKERRFVHILTPMSAVLTVGGILFMLRIMLPIMLAFFITFGADMVPQETHTVPRPEGSAPGQVLILDGDLEDPHPGDVWVNRELDSLRICLEKGADGKLKIKEMPLTESAVIKTTFTLSDYIGFVLGMALAFALAFQMPVVVLLLGWVGILKPKVMGKYRRHAIFICGVVGAIVTPTGDPFSMFLLAGPLYALYELGLVMLRVMPVSRVVASAEAKEKRNREAAAAKAAEGAAGDTKKAGPVNDGSDGVAGNNEAGAAAGKREADTDDEGP